MAEIGGCRGPDPGGRSPAVQRRTVWVLSIGQVLGGLAFGAIDLARRGARRRDLGRRGVLGARHGRRHPRHRGLRRAARRVRAPPRPTPVARERHGGRAGGVVLVILAAAVGVVPAAARRLRPDRRGAGGEPAVAVRRGRPRDRRHARPRPLARRLGDDDRRGARAEPDRARARRSGRRSGCRRSPVRTCSPSSRRCSAIALYLIWLRPDPLLLAQRVVDARRALERPERSRSPTSPIVARYAIFAVAAAHGVMVSVMAMTPVHLLHHGASLTVIGLTISLHVAGMFALSPVFGILADRLGRVPTILLGQVLLAAALRHRVVRRRSRRRPSPSRSCCSGSDGARRPSPARRC